MNHTPQLRALDIAARLELNPPTEQQQRIIEAPLEPLLVVAGAGSGKTETMSARVVYLVANGLVRPEQILGLTFTRKAAGELQERIGHRLQQLRRTGLLPNLASTPEHSANLDILLGDSNAHVSTYNSFAANLVTQHGVKVGINGSRSLLREAASWQLIHEIVTSWQTDLDVSTDAPSTIEDAVKQLAGQCADHLLTYEQLEKGLLEIADYLENLPIVKRRKYTRDENAVLESLRGRAALIPMLQAYERRKTDDEVMDFSDQVTLAARIVAEAPEVVAEYRDTYRVVLLDEFQDTSHAQLELLRGLFGDGHATTAVGDPQQSIYGWRGASAAGLAAFRSGFGAARETTISSHALALGQPHELRREPTRQYDLSTSWRNDNVILDVANACAEPLREDSRKADVEVQELTSRPQAGPGRVEARYFRDAQREADYIADLLADLENTRRRAVEAGTDTPIKTMAVLVRARSLMPRLEQTLRERGLKVSVSGLGGLLHVPEVADLRAFLEVAHDPSRGDSLMRLLTGPKYRIGHRDIAVLGEYSRHLARLEATDTAVGSRAAQASSGADATAAGSVAPHAVAPDGSSAAAGSNSDAPDAQAAEPAAAVPDHVDGASLIDAIEELPTSGYTDRYQRSLSAAAIQRLHSLAASLKTVRRLTALPLPELVYRAMCELGIDIEAQVSYGTSGYSATTDLHALITEAETFAREATYPRLGAFLAWLDAADAREAGLERRLVDPPTEGTVSLLTMHGAKGLEWDLTIVPGLYEGGFPSKGKDGKLAWLTGLKDIPYPLRGDSRSLPALRLEDATDQGEMRELLKEYGEEVAEYRLREERRLAYVAFTRARKHLVLTCASWPNDTAKNAVKISQFMAEATRVPGVEVDPELTRLLELQFAWSVLEEELATAKAANDTEEATRLTTAIEDLKGEELTENPLSQAIFRTEVPAPETPSEITARATATSISERIEEIKARGAAPELNLADVNLNDLTAHLSAASKARVSRWWREAILLLAEAHSTHDETTIEVVVPPHLSASDVVNWSSDPQKFLAQLRRRVPSKPNPNARRGTKFHAALEHRFNNASLLGPEDLPDATDGFDDMTDISDLLATFDASRWAHRTPEEVEAVFELPLAGITIRGSIDAVFVNQPDTGLPHVQIVDWKTGRPAQSAREKTSREMQLALYRLAWHYRSGVPLTDIAAGFYYASDGSEAWADDLPDADALEHTLTSWWQPANATERQS